MKQKPFSRDFILVIIGQIISLSGNAIIRFALPLYLLNQTGSSALYGAVTACAFLPPSCSHRSEASLRTGSAKKISWFFWTFLRRR